MTIRSQFSAGMVLLVLACGLFCSASCAAEIGGDTGYFEITSDPSGGAVYFDGSYKGTTPVTFPVLVTGSPSHTIRVTKSGYYDWQQNYQGYSWFRFDGLAMGALLAIWMRSPLASVRNSIWLAGLLVASSVIITVPGLPYGILMSKTPVAVALRYTQVTLVFGAFILDCHYPAWNHGHILFAHLVY